MTHYAKSQFSEKVLMKKREEQGGLGLAAKVGLNLGSIRIESMGASMEDLKTRLGTKTSIDVVDTKLMVHNQPIC